jgi:hypothetical protein
MSKLTKEQKHLAFIVGNLTRIQDNAEKHVGDYIK